MNKETKFDPFDLGSEPTGEDFDPFAPDNNDTESKSNATRKSKVTDTAAKASATNSPDNNEQNNTDKSPVFEYAGATEDIDDVSKTFEELRIVKSVDFPELEDGKRVSWTVEYGKITKSVADPKGITIGKMKSDIETSKEFQEALKKAKDKKPICKVKPRVTAQSKGMAMSYKGVFRNMDEVNAADKVISILPAKDGKVYEIRKNVMGKFITPLITESLGGSCELLSDVRAGFVSALPRIPVDMMMKIVTFFRYCSDEGDGEAILNIYWDRLCRSFHIDAPEQTATKASVESVENLNFADDRYIHFMDIHSHNDMKAFFSAVDDKDEKATRLYSVIGHLDKYFPDIKTRISNGGKFCEIDPSEVFELVAKPFPDDWKSKVHFRECHEVDNGISVDNQGVDVL